MGYERMKNCYIAEKDNRSVKEIFYNIDHSKIEHNHSMEIGYERIACHNILNENLSERENEIYIEILEGNFDND